MAVISARIVLFLTALLIGTYRPGVAWGEAALSSRADAPGTMNPDIESVSYPGNQSFARIPFELLANCPYVSLKVNGKGPFTFAIDTGSIDSPLASETLSELGITSTNPGSRRGDIEFTFDGGFQIRTERSKSLSMAGLWPLLGRRIHGIIGYDVLKHFVVEFDYERKLVTFYDPKKYTYTGSGTIFPVTMVMGYDPQVSGEFNVAGIGTVKAGFTIDTGAGGTVVTTPIVQKHGLIEKVTQKVPSPGHGVSGMEFDDVVGRISSIQLGNITIDRPLVALSLDTDGPLAMDDLGVNVGGNILQRFGVTVNYPQRQLILQPNAQFHDPFTADASGLVLKAVGDDFRAITVQGVVAGSPADEAGMQAGDVISNIDGDSTDKYTLWQIQDLFKRSGKQMTVALLKKDGKTATVKIKLRALA
jgi:PDZ domain/Aspartyl protease